MSDNENMLVKILKSFLNLSQGNGIPLSGQTKHSGLLYDQTTELQVMFVGVAANVTGYIGESHIAIHYNGLINKASFKVSVEHRPAVIMDLDEIDRLLQIVT